MERFLKETNESDEYRLRVILELLRHYRKVNEPEDARRIATLCYPGDYKPNVAIIGLVTSINNEVAEMDRMASTKEEKP